MALQRQAMEILTVYLLCGTVALLVGLLLLQTATDSSLGQRRRKLKNFMCDTGDHRATEVRMFGEFYCQYCHYGWSSGNAWAGKGQQCKMCQRMVLPRSLRPLNAQPYDSDKDRKPHKRNLCQKCQELGYDCRNHVPSLSRHPSTTSVATNRRQQRSTAIAGATFRTKQTTTITSSTDLNCAIL